MKKLLKAALLCVLCILIFTSCMFWEKPDDDGPPNDDENPTDTDKPTVPPTPDIPTDPPADTPLGVSVESLVSSVAIKDEAVSDYDFTALFKITDEGVEVSVLAEYIDKNAVSTTPGEYTVYCTYGGKEASVTVEVIATVYSLTLSEDSVDLSQSELAAYDFKSLFTAEKDGETVAITDEMITTDLTAEPGVYEYTVSFGGISRTLSVTVVPNHWVEAIPAYRELSLTLSELAEFDFTSLFSLFIDGAPVRVTSDMIDISALESAEIGGVYKVLFAHTYDGTSAASECLIRIVEEQKISIRAKNIVTYPNGAPIDLASLFEIRKGDTVLEAPVRYITGSIDYTAEGVYPITLNYPDHEPVVAEVEVKGGVVILAPDGVTVRKGTSVADYPFENDVTVIINGVRFTEIPISCFDLSAVDFNTVGDYPVTLTIKYNETPLSGLAGVAKYENVTKTITYTVSDVAYEASVKAPSLLLGIGTTSYNVFNNLFVKINGINQTFTTNPNHVDIISCYAEVLSEPIDFTSVADQEVRVAVYVNGPESEPIELSYSLRVEADISITADGAQVFVGSPLLVKDLFHITEAGKPVPVTYDMISGKVDVFKAGTYTASLVYRGIHTEATVVVLDDEMLGTYHTKLTTIGTADSEDGDGYIESGEKAKQLADLIIRSDGTVMMQGRSCPIVSAIDERTFTIRYYSFLHTLHYDDGVVTVDPENSIKLSYSNEKRPAVYFHERDWTVEKRFTVDQTSSYVLDSATGAHYSIDLFYLTSTKGEPSVWYGQKVHLVSKISSDTVYVNTWGVAEVGSGFESAAVGDVAQITLDGITYEFTILSSKAGKINKEDEINKIWANQTFTGTVEGKEAQLKVNNYGHYTLWVDGVKLLTTDMQSFYRMKYGGVNEAASSLILYDYADDEYEPYSYYFMIDEAAHSFTLVERDSLFGFYELGDMYIFLNGYGHGVINFNKKSYTVTELAYELIGQELHITYLDTIPTFTHGKGAVLYTHPLGNLLTAKSFADVCEVGAVWRNSVIVDGAIVDMETLQIGAGTKAKDEFYQRISITTKDGVMSDTDKKACLTTNTVKWTAPGFYRFAVTVSVGGEKVTSYYTVQILSSLATEAPIAQIFGQGILFQNSFFSLDLYGRIKLSIGDVTYAGLATFGAENSEFSGRAYAPDGSMIALRGGMLHDGVIKVTSSGAANFTELYTTGSAAVAGCSGAVLRAFTVGGKTIYRLAASLSGIGEEASVTCLGTDSPFVVGAILKVESASKTVYVKVNSWGSPSQGLTESDPWRGTYTSEGKDDLVLDGFGKATLGDNVGSYRRNGKWIVVNFTGLHGFLVDTESYTYTEEALPFGAASFVGKSFGVSYKFVCDGVIYDASTTFAFLEDGKVTITSTSPSHDSATDGCTVDTYSPVFVTSDANPATYSVSADMLTVSVGGISFTFYVEDVISVNQLKLNSTNLPDDAHGYISIGAVLTLG
ncbi:MAG: hypothetical protein IKC32_05175 [Clostridia bacterium]|nr:hypothetical protein [Clostridia bacterium]